MSKRKTDDGSDWDSMTKQYGAPPPLSEEFIRRLQGAVTAARQERTRSQKRAINPFFDSAPDVDPDRPADR